MANALLFIHGSLSSGRMWRRHQALFKERPTLAPDLLGAGSNPPVNFKTGWSIEAELQALEAHYDALPGPITLIAHSFGGALALLLAARQPERIRRVIAHEPLSFPLLNSPADQTLFESIGDKDFYLDESKAGSVEWVAGVVDFWSGPGTWAAMDDTRQQFALALGSKAFFEVRFGISEGVSPEVLAQIPCPVHITVGVSAPPAERRAVEIITELVPQSELVVVPGGHNAPLTHPQTWVPRVLSWL